MKTDGATFDAVRAAASGFPEFVEGRSYGAPALKLAGKTVACIAINRSAEPDTLAVRVGFEERDELIASEPDRYYLTDHYEPYPWVLVRLARIGPDVLSGLLAMALNNARREMS